MNKYRGTHVNVLTLRDVLRGSNIMEDGTHSELSPVPGYPDSRHPVQEVQAHSQNSSAHTFEVSSALGVDIGSILQPEYDIGRSYNPNMATLTSRLASFPGCLTPQVYRMANAGFYHLGEISAE